MPDEHRCFFRLVAVFILRLRVDAYLLGEKRTGDKEGVMKRTTNVRLLEMRWQVQI